MIPLEWLSQARQRLQPHLTKTPLTFDPRHNFYLKWENRQVTGSFKARGALNKGLSLAGWEIERGLVAASAGNHGQGVALAGRITGASTIIFASESAVPVKIAAMTALGAEVRLVPGGYGQAEEQAIRYAAQTGSTWISPYNDGLVIAGQGTLGLEALEQLSGLEAAVWIAPAGGGGLVAGIGASLEASERAHTLIAGQSSASPFLHALYHHGSQAEAVELPSLADGLAGPVEEGSVTIPLVQKYVDDFLLVSEDDIAHAVVYAWRRYQERIEASAALPLALALSGKVSQRPAILIISGGNIQPETHAEILQRYPPESMPWPEAME
jgi:threonine dehydratase